MTKRKPRHDHLRIFGCLYFANNLVMNDKFVSLVVPSIFMGYSETQKGYKLYNFDTKTLFVSRDVKFYEHMFPFLKHNHDISIIMLNRQFVHDDIAYEISTIPVR